MYMQKDNKIINKCNDVKGNVKKYSKIKQKINRIKLNYTRNTSDPIRNIFAINSLGATIIMSTILYIYIAGILSLFVSEDNFHFMRETMRILECISISIVSYFFGGIFKRDKTVDKTKND